MQYATQPAHASSGFAGVGTRKYEKVQKNSPLQISDDYGPGFYHKVDRILHRSKVTVQRSEDHFEGLLHNILQVIFTSFVVPAKQNEDLRSKEQAIIGSIKARQKLEITEIKSRYGEQ